MRFLVLGDIHANSLALEAALEIAAEVRFDRLIILGDLFTYGVEPKAVYELVRDMQRRNGALLLIGNHDEFYLSDHERVRGYLETVPTWIRESVDWTRDQLQDVDLSMLDWRKSYVESGAYFAHANPFEFPDWRYLNTDHEHREAAVALGQRGYQLGVFGHTHRQKVVSVRESETSSRMSRTVVSEIGESVILVNAGSVGQPRNAERRSYALILDIDGARAISEFAPIEYDVERHKALIRGARLSDRTTDNLLGFFE